MIDITEACVDTETELLHLQAVIDDAVYVRGSQTLFDPPEYKPGLFQAEVRFDSLPEEFDPAVEDLVSHLRALDFDPDMYEWILVDNADDDI